MTDAATALGVLVLDQDDHVESANRAAGAWLDELGADDAPRHPLPSVVRAVAAQTRAVTPGDETRARARVLTPAGNWAVLRGSLLGDGPGARVAVVLEAARPAERAPLIADAYGLTERERRVTEVVARGLSTVEAAAELHLSPYTVQDHLKAIFERTGTRSRGELVARLFFDDHAPQLGSPST